jgi:hypothetical protein
MVFEPAAEAEEVLSPELVLVATPEEAQRARERLPERPGLVWSTSTPAPPTTRSPVEPAWFPPYPRIAIEDLLPDRPRRRNRGPLLLAACLLVAVAAAGYVAETRWLGGGDTVAAPVAAAAPVTPATPKQRLPSVARPPTHPARAAGVPKPQAHKKRLPSTASPQAHISPKPKPTPKPAVVPPATVTHSPAIPAKNTIRRDATRHAQPAVKAKPKPTTPPPGTAAEFIPSRTWAWVPSAGAAAYDVSFFLNGKVVLHVRPKAARLVLPGSFRYRAGHYRWTVRPLGTTAVANPIVDGDFVLTTAAAAAANRS